jgi:hypothetical protein
MASKSGRPTDACNEQKKQDKRPNPPKPNRKYDKPNVHVQACGLQRILVKLKNDYQDCMAVHDKQHE